MLLIPFVQYHKNENKYKLRFLLVLFFFFLFKLQPFAFVENRPQDWVPVICSFVHTEAIELSGALLLMSTQAGS